MHKLLVRIKEESDWGKLNEDQQNFCIQVLRGQNTLLTGSAGTGKSFVVNFLLNFLESQGVSVGKSATTGVAALQIGGSTIHSWAGIGLANTDFKTIAQGVWRNKKAVARIKYTKVLFVDEVSMLSGNIFEIIDKMFRTVRLVKDKPFGGIQVIFSGDFLQLPPVFKDLTIENQFVFETDAWKDSKIKNCVLTKIVRQEHDSVFANLLEEIRFGNTENIGILDSRIWAKIENKNGIQPVQIFGYNKVVDAYNRKVLDNLAGISKTYWSNDRGEQRHIDFFNKNCPAAKKVDLKIGAQVMLVYNISVEKGFVNGSVGKVIRFEEKYPVVKFDCGELIVESQKWEIKEQIAESDGSMKYKTVAHRSQIPLKLAWSITVHKSQGKTLESVVIDLNQAFESGSGYVALSRVRNLESLSLRPFDAEKIRANQKCLEFYENMKNNS